PKSRQSPSRSIAFRRMHNSINGNSRLSRSTRTMATVTRSSCIARKYRVGSNPGNTTGSLADEWGGWARRRRGQGGRSRRRDLAVRKSHCFSESVPRPGKDQALRDGLHDPIETTADVVHKGVSAHKDRGQCNRLEAAHWP